MFKQQEKINMENVHEKHDHQELFNAAWEKSNENFLIKGLKAGQKVEDLLSQAPGFKEAFDHDLDTLDCSDGRVRNGAKMGVAGEGILLSPEEWSVLVESLKAKKAALGRELLITGHEGCGAAGMAHPGDPDSDRFGYATAQKLAAETGNLYKEVRHEAFISQIHNERALVVEGTGKFDVANWEEFPAQFISSSAALNLGDAYVQKEVTALTGIALGDHGFSDKRFDAANPFYVIVAASDAEQLSRLLAVAEEATRKFGDKVKVDGFVAPAKE